MNLSDEEFDDAIRKIYDSEPDDPDWRAIDRIVEDAKQARQRIRDLKARIEELEAEIRWSQE